MPSRGDWRPIEAGYRQVSAAAGTEDGPTDRLAGYLAYRLGRTFAQYDKYEAEFISELLECWCEVDKKQPGVPSFQQLYFDKRFNAFPSYSGAGRRGRPKPFEAAVETVRRLVTVNAIRDATASHQCAAILGGSVSYGRFYNTKGTNDPSDLDLVVVIPDYAGALISFAKALKDVPGLDVDDIDALTERVSLIDPVVQEYKNVTVSHSFRIWTKISDPLISKFAVPSFYMIQMHFFTASMLDYMLLDDMASIELANEKDPTRRIILDFRNDEPHRGTTSTECCFGGTPEIINRDVRKVDGGWVAEESVFYLAEGRFYPGIFHNLVIPQFEIRWDRTDQSLNLKLMVFQSKLTDRLIKERQLRPWEDQTIENSHMRGRLFSPHVSRKVSNMIDELI